MDAVYDLLKDIQDLTKISTCGDEGVLRQMTAEEQFKFLDDFRAHLLASARHQYWRKPETGDKRYDTLLANFMRSVRRNVFSDSGKILPFPCQLSFRHMYAVACIYQKYGCSTVTDSMKAEALEQYVSDEIRVRTTPIWRLGGLEVEAKRLLAKYFFKYLPVETASPRHGPGTVSEGYKYPWEKYRFIPVEGMDSYDPDIRLFNPRKSNFSAEVERARLSRLCFVPKNRKKCRVICAEPSLLQWMQQGYRNSLYRAIEASPVEMDLRDQTINQKVARESSSHGYYATIDLKSASDLLSLQLVRELFPWPVSSAYAACRSTATMVATPSGPRTIELEKFGSMGNALTFPVQSLVFWSLIAAMRMHSGDSESEAIADTWVYGDDIVFPSHHYVDVATMLDMAGLIVNHDKSFESGLFRESCGMHAFNGYDVTPQYVRNDCQTLEGLSSVCASARGFHRLGYTRTAEKLYHMVEDALGTGLPVSRSEAGFSRFTYHESPWHIARENESRGFKVRYNGTKGIPAVRAQVIAPKYKFFGHFDCSWDLWDFIGPYNGSVRDRGIVASGKRLTHSWIPLVERL